MFCTYTSGLLHVFYMFLYKSMVTATVAGEVSLFYVVYVPLGLLINQPQAPPWGSKMTTIANN